MDSSSASSAWFALTAFVSAQGSSGGWFVRPSLTLAVFKFFSLYLRFNEHAMTNPDFWAVSHLKRLVAGFPQRWPEFDPGWSLMGSVVSRAALRYVSSECFGFPCQSFHRLHHTCRHLSSGAGVIGQIFAKVPVDSVASLGWILGRVPLSTFIPLKLIHFTSCSTIVTIYHPELLQ
jgi:hypothetical protein